MRDSVFLFRFVCLGFSALLLVLSLSRRTELFDLEQEIYSLEAQLGQEKTQAEILSVRLENRLSLEELETWALGHGMALPSAGQIVYISMEN